MKLTHDEQKVALKNLGSSKEYQKYDDKYKRINTIGDAMQQRANCKDLSVGWFWKMLVDNTCAPRGAK